MVGEGNVITLPSVPWMMSQQEKRREKQLVGIFCTPICHMHCLKGAFAIDKKLSGFKTHN